MNRSRWIAILVLLPLVGFSQEQSKPNLARLSSSELKACQFDHSLCGVDRSSLAVNDELAKRLGDYTVDKLLDCYVDWEICGVEESRPTGQPISDYLASQGDPHDLLARYWKERRWIVRNGIERVAYQFDTPEITSFMQRAIKSRVYDGEDLYWPAKYLAKRCYPIGLNWLKTGKGRNQGGFEYEFTLEYFGKCGYRPAIPLLVNCLFDFSGNVVIGAEDSLDELYPDHPKDLDANLDDVQKYYCGRAHKEGFKFRCNR